MRKLFGLVFISALIMTSVSWAESSAVGYTGTRYEEQQVWIAAYNNSGGSISSNQLVILDTGGGGGDSGATLGAYITTTTVASNQLIIGITDEIIANGSVGRICVRGPHKVQLTSNVGVIAGATVGSTTTAGRAAALRGLDTGTVADIYNASRSGSIIGNIINPNGETISLDDGANCYWIWVQKQ